MYGNHFDEENKLWSSKYSPLVFDPRLSLGFPILWSLEKNPHKVIQVDKKSFLLVVQKLLELFMNGNLAKKNINLNLDQS